MKGPMGLVRSDKLPGFENAGPLYEWSDGETYLMIDQVTYRGTSGAVLAYYNPPVHQVGNPELDAFLAGLDRVLEKGAELSFLVYYGANDPVHAGGDLKESLNKLDRTLELKKEKQAAGAPPEDVDQLYEWADARLKKGFSLYEHMRQIAGRMRLVAVCGGGTRFGGSAEIPLMADYLLGDSRSGMCFSEAMIGLIPGWSGIGRVLTKAGKQNAEYMAKTSTPLKAADLRTIGVYNEVVEVEETFPRRDKTGDRDADKARYKEALEDHNHRTGLLLLPKALEMATCPEGQIRVVEPDRRPVLLEEQKIAREVERRKDPENYSHLWNRPIREVKEELEKLGRPLAPQSIEALDELFQGYDPGDFDEQDFVRKESQADAQLYRDPRFRAGLTATLEQKVADFRLPSGA